MKFVYFCFSIYIILKNNIFVSQVKHFSELSTIDFSFMIFRLYT